MGESAQASGSVGGGSGGKRSSKGGGRGGGSGAGPGPIGPIFWGEAKAALINAGGGGGGGGVDDLGGPEEVGGLFATVLAAHLDDGTVGESSLSPLFSPKITAAVCSSIRFAGLGLFFLV